MRLQREMKSSSWTMRLKRANKVAHFDDEAQAVESDFSIERRQEPIPGEAKSTFNVFKQTRHLTMLQLSRVMFHNLQITCHVHK